MCRFRRTLWFVVSYPFVAPLRSRTATRTEDKERKLTQLNSLPPKPGHVTGRVGPIRIAKYGAGDGGPRPPGRRPRSFHIIIESGGAHCDVNCFAIGAGCRARHSLSHSRAYHAVTPTLLPFLIPANDLMPLQPASNSHM